ncbi:MAG: alpha-1,4-glucan--maltose-1-phosphate maltosyltransferase [Acidobacteriota bacterium]
MNRASFSAFMQDDRGEDRTRVIIEGVRPQVDWGRFPAKAVIGERVVVEADIFTDGHDRVSAALLYRFEDDREWSRIPMQELVNDRWRADFEVTRLGRYLFTLEAWVDHFLTWHHDLLKRLEAGQDVGVDLLIGAGLIESAAKRAGRAYTTVLNGVAAQLRGNELRADAVRQILEPDFLAIMTRVPDLSFSTVFDKELEVSVDPERAGFSTWYELFPRSAGGEGAHGTFRDVEARLPEIAAMGFDILYMPPIHPIGTAFRKGRNNAVVADESSVGSPWAIGAADGGHTAIHHELGTFEDFDHLVAAAKLHGLDIALDIAFQVSPDHPWVSDHEQWFRKRPDGTIQYAENPPKKYQDIYPFNFESPEWRSLWDELLNVFLFWVDKGIRIFRVDNPHTKPLPFWEWCIGSIKKRFPDTIFLAEAFTRPKVMYYLAKAGFSQSYTYFAWRRNGEELREYFEELTQTEVKDFFRPNVWPNTPDILTDQLQQGGRPAFMQRLVLAATLSANYGIYGPAFELLEHDPREEGSEEYLHSEKYEIRAWKLDDPNSLVPFITRTNRIRRENTALHSNHSLLFHETTNEQLLAYSKSADGGGEVILTIVNLDPWNRQTGFVDLPLKTLGIGVETPFEVHDLLSDARYTWRGSRNYVDLDPWVVPAHVFHVRTSRRTERDFDTVSA